ncbi:MAG: tetratricopeptide repeat protein [Cyanobacteria bacterium TGS_CYA1]|nr:tetratricopeptide repeat protein [Cyanobacteria bacterium TGS_CYA1]
MQAKYRKAFVITACLLSLAGLPSAHAEDRIAHLRYLGSAELNWQTQKREEALKDIDKSIEAYSGNAGAYLLRASMRGTMGNHKGVVDDCNRALYLKPDMDAAVQIRAVAYAALGKYKEAIEDLTTLIDKRKNDTKSYLTRADVYGMADDEKMSRKDINKALELEPSNARAKRALVIWHLQFRKFKEALPLTEKYVSENPKSADAHYFLARAHSGNNQIQKAIEDCTQAINLDPKFYRAFTSRGYYKLILKDYKGSIIDSDSSIKLDSKNAVPVQNKALAYFLQNDYLKAADLYKSAAGLYDKKERKVRSRLLAAFSLKLAGKATESKTEMALTKKEAEKTNLGTLLLFMEGGTTADKVLAVAPKLEYQCTAKTMMALELLRLKKTKEAHDYFNWVIANGDGDEDETYISKAFLDRKAF